MDNDILRNVIVKQLECNTCIEYKARTTEGCTVTCPSLQRSSDSENSLGVLQTYASFKLLAITFHPIIKLSK